MKTLLILLGFAVLGYGVMHTPAVQRVVNLSKFLTRCSKAPTTLCARRDGGGVGRPEGAVKLLSETKAFSLCQRGQAGVRPSFAISE
jgi:hypothetical protein